MLGRLEMSIDDCIDSYGKFMDKIFRNEHGKLGQAASLVFHGAKFGSHDLEDVVKQIVGEKLGDKNALLLSDRPKESGGKECKV